MRVRIDLRKVFSRATRAGETVVAAVAEQALMDSNYYAPVEYGNLQESALVGSDVPNGVLRWGVPYAQMRYFTGVPKTGINPNASTMWFDRAKHEHMDDWQTVADQSFRKGFKQR